MATSRKEKSVDSEGEKAGLSHFLADISSTRELSPPSNKCFKPKYLCDLLNVQEALGNLK